MTDPMEGFKSTGIPHWQADCARCSEELANKLQKEGKITFMEAIMHPMWLCPLCGNKRCPKASWHGYKCTRSNEPGQVAELEEV